MSESTYSVIFRGDLEPGFTVADVKGNFARLFKVGPDTVEKLFSGRPLALKKGLSEGQAAQLQATLTRLGAQSVVRAEAPVHAPPAAPKPVAPETPVSAPQAQVPETAAAGGEEVPAAPSASLSLAPMEGNLLKDHERSRVDPVQVQVGHLSLKPAEGNLLEAGEREPQAPAPVSVPEWNLESNTSFKLPD